MSTPLDPSITGAAGSFAVSSPVDTTFGPGYSGTALAGSVIGAGPASPWAPAGQAPFGPGSPGYGVFVPQKTGAQQLVQEFYNFTPQQRNQLRTSLSMINSNYLTAPDTDSTGGQSLLSAWTGLVGTAQQYNANGQNLTPWDVLAKDVSATSGGPPTGAHTATRTTSQVNLTIRVDAQAIFYQSAQQLLGRAPTDSEVASFQGFLNAKERANPITATVNTSYDATGQVIGSDTTKSSGGVSANAANMLAMQKAQQSPEYGAYQAATTYMNALKQAIGR